MRAAGFPFSTTILVAKAAKWTHQTIKRVSHGSRVYIAINQLLHKSHNEKDYKWVIVYKFVFQERLYESFDNKLVH